MSPRSSSVNEELRERSRLRILNAAYELLAERGYAGTTLSEIAKRAGTARGLISYYFPSKQHLFQATVHRMMYTRLTQTLDRIPVETDPDERLALTIDRILQFAAEQPAVFRAHLSLILQPDAAGFVDEPERRRLGSILQEVLAIRGSTNPAVDHAVLRSALMGAVIGIVLPGAESPLEHIRAHLFGSYGLRWTMGDPPTPKPPRLATASNPQ
ncbi:MAG TPA: TetR/AcrR family transcriptional regulator [Mycobacteriales bacterium]|nr:TetR/AcrR family transcriptional regulator [Mycobacteriales bacterium]